MKAEHFSRAADETKRNATGVLIPVCIPDNEHADMSHALLEDTVQAFLRELNRPDALCLSADGGGRGADAAREAARRWGCRAVFSEPNRGKLFALRAGMRRLLGDERLRCFVTADQDGDHFANELASLVRAVQHVENRTGNDCVLVIGRRASLHRPMGYARGDLEEWVDRLLLDALAYRAAQVDRPLSLQFSTPVGEVPDFHSGYKLLTRPAATAVFANAPRTCGAADDVYYRHAVEAVIAVEAVEAGAVLAQVNRSTFDEQPVSLFGAFDRRRLFADMIVWPCLRLEIPAAFARQWMCNHAPRILLSTLLPAGREELLAVQRLVLEALGDGSARDLPDEIQRPAFV